NNMLQEMTYTDATNKAHDLVYIYTAEDERLWTYTTTTPSGGTATALSYWTLRDLGGKVQRQYKDDGTTFSVVRDYFYRDGLLLGATNADGTKEHFSLDHLGTPRLITDGSGFK